MGKIRARTFLRENVTVIILFLVAVWGRVMFIDFQGLSNDELSAWYRVRFSDWESFWFSAVQSGDMHPYLYQFFLMKWLHIFGESELAIRSLALLFFVGNMFWIVSISKRFFHASSAHILLAIYAGSTFFIVNTITSRPYSSGLFFLLMALYFLLALWESSKTWKQDWVNILCLSVGLYGAMTSHYFAFLVAAILGVVAFSFLGKAQKIKLVLSGGLAVLFFIPHLPVTLYQLSAGGLNWLDAPSLIWPLDFLWQILNQSVLCLFLLLIFVFIGKPKVKTNDKSRFLLLVFLFVFLITTLLSYLFTPIVRELTFQFIFPLLIWGILGALEFERKIFLSYFSIGFAFLFLMHSVFKQQVFERVHYGEFEQIAENENKVIKLYGEDQVECIQNFNNAAYLGFYTKRSYPNQIQNWSDPATPQLLKTKLDQTKKNILLYNWSNNYHHPLFIEVMLSHFPKLIRHQSYFNSEYFLFSKEGNDTKLLSIKNQKISKPEKVDLEFYGEMNVEVKDLKKYTKEAGYFMVQAYFSEEVESELYLVAVANRGGEMLNFNNNPVLYEAFDIRMLSSSNQSIKTVFVLKEKLKDSDEIKIYLYNPKRQSFALKNIQLSYRTY